MVKRAVIAFLFSLLLSMAAAQDTARVGSPRKSPRMMLIIDVSGSMGGTKLSKAIKTAIEVVINPTDDIEIGVITFATRSIRLLNPFDNDTNKPIPDELFYRCSPWFRLPSKNIIDALLTALKSLDSGGSTNPNDALRQAFNEECQTIVFITDGRFNKGGDPADVVKAAHARLAKDKKLIPRFVIIPIKGHRCGLKVLEEMAKKCGAILWIPLADKEPEPVPGSKQVPKIQLPPSGPHR